MRKRLAFRQGGDKDGDECDAQEPTDCLQTNLVLSPPHRTCQTLEEFGHGEFGNPEAIAISLGRDLWRYGVSIILTTMRT